MDGVYPLGVNGAEQRINGWIIPTFNRIRLPPACANNSRILVKNRVLIFYLKTFKWPASLIDLRRVFRI